MSEFVLPKAGAARRNWRDVITPVGRASRRRWTLAFPVLLVFFTWFDIVTFDDDPTGVDLIEPVALLVIFGMLRRSTRRLTALDHPELDERDQVARDRAFRLAYPLLVAILLGSVALLAFVLPEATRPVPADFPPGSTFPLPGGHLRIEALIGLLLWLGVWAVFLPTGVLAWREPDALEPDPGEPADGLSEVARDTWLAGALGAGIALGVIQSVDFFPVLPVIAGLALLGARARRAAASR